MYTSTFNLLLIIYSEGVLVSKGFRIYKSDKKRLTQILLKNTSLLISICKATVHLLKLFLRC